MNMEEIRFAKLKRGTFYKIPFKTAFQGATFDTIYIENDVLVFADSEHYKIDGVSLKELFKSRKGKE